MTQQQIDTVDRVYGHVTPAPPSQQDLEDRIAELEGDTLAILAIYLLMALLFPGSVPQQLPTTGAQ